MDLQKEREAFEAWHYDQYLLENPNIDISNAKYIYDYAHKNALVYQLKESHFTAWQAAKAQVVPGWISVKDKLPPANILVLGMSQTRSNIFNVYNVMDLDEFEEAEVTHWMPLPDAPQEPKNKQFNLNEFLAMEEKLKSKGGVIAAELDRFIAYAEMVLEKAKALKEPK